MSIETTLLELGYSFTTARGNWTLTSADGTKAVTVSPNPPRSGLYHYAVTVLVPREHFVGRHQFTTETRAIETNTFSGPEALKLLGA